MAVQLRRPGHRLEGLVNRFRWHLDKTQKYVSTVMPAVKEKGDPEIEQYMFGSLALMLHSHMEDFYKGVVRTAVPSRPQELREHMVRYYGRAIKDLETVPILQLARTASVKEVAFAEKAERLKRVFGVLFDMGPFADADAECDCLDLVVVRNTIAHDGAWPDERVYNNLCRKDLIIETTHVNGAAFYALDIPPRFLRDTLAGLVRSVLDFDERMRTHPVYRI